jgi:macrolide transport system ATP-binding/permease protein
MGSEHLVRYDRGADAEIELTIVIGARRLHVFLQFPAEAASLSVSGGGSTVIATGIAFSARISPFFARGRRSQVAITGGFPFATALGLFSSKPASDSIEALRYQ